MRGADVTQEALFSTIRLEDFVPSDHPLRSIREIFNDSLKRLNWLFEEAYSPLGKASIAPEKLVRALLLRVLYSVRSNRELMEQIRYNLLFRWFIGLSIDDAVWDHSTFSKNQDRLLEHEVITALFTEVVEQARKRDLMSDEHFSVDGTLIQAWASQKSFRPRDEDASGPRGRNEARDFHGEKRSNDTHASTTDPEARNYKKAKGAEARLAYLGHTLMENRNGLIVEACVSEATGYAEREQALGMLEKLPGKKRRTVGADKGYDTQGFVAGCRERRITPHVACNTRRKGGSALDGRTTRHAGYKTSIKCRKRIEEGFGWAKTVGPIRQAMVRGSARVNDLFMLTFIGYNLTRMRNIQARCAR